MATGFLGSIKIYLIFHIASDMNGNLVESGANYHKTFLEIASLKKYLEIILLSFEQML